VKELIVGLPARVTVTVAVDVVEPAAFVAVSVYVVVATGLTLVDPLGAEDVNVPGVMAIEVAPFTDQFNVLLVPEFTLVGFAVNDAIVGFEPLPEVVLVFECAAAAQPIRYAPASSSKNGTAKMPSLLLRKNFAEFVRGSVFAIIPESLVIGFSRCLLVLRTESA